MPDHLDVRDERFLHLTLPICDLQQLCSDMLWAEGPVYFADGNYLLCSDIPNNRIMQWVDGLGERVFRHPSNNSNGNTRDRQGRLVTCEHLERRVVRTEADGSVTVLADQYDGKRLNSPNDVVVKSDGSVWFTDPTYGIMTDYEGRRSESEIGACNVYRLDAQTGRLDIVADDFDKPNGLAFSPDESVLYISDTGVSHRKGGPHHIRAFDVRDGKRLANGRVFAEIESAVADGFRTDIAGNVWTSAGHGVECYDPQGTLLGRIQVPELVANLTFGGAKRNRLFITAKTSLYAIYVATTGAQTP